MQDYYDITSSYEKASPSEHKSWHLVDLLISFNSGPTLSQLA